MNKPYSLGDLEERPIFIYVILNSFSLLVNSRLSVKGVSERMNLDSRAEWSFQVYNKLFVSHLAHR